MENEIIKAPTNSKAVQMTNDLVSISGEKLNMKPTPELLQIAQDMKAMHQDIQNFIKTYDPENATDDDFKARRAQATKLRKQVNQVNDGIKQVKRFLEDNMVTAPIDQLEKFLIENDFNELNNDMTIFKQFEKDVQNERKANRWLEIKAIFDDNLELYPNVQTKLPRLANFEAFKARNDSLVTAAQNAKIGNKHMEIINSGFYTINEDLKSIINLHSPFEQQLLENYQQLQEISATINLNTQLIENARKAEEKRKADIEAAAKRLVAQKEAQRLAEEKRKADIQAAAKKAELEKQKAKERLELEKLKKQNVNTAQLSPIAKKLSVNYGWYVAEISKESYGKLNNNVDLYYAVADFAIRVKQNDPTIMKNISSVDQALDLIRTMVNN